MRQFLRVACSTGLLLSAMVFSSSTAKAVVINFDSIAAGTTITNQFPEVTFSSTPGNHIQVVFFPGDTSPPNIICSASDVGGLNCMQDILLDFTNPVSGLTFLSAGDDGTGILAQVDVFGAGLALLGTADILGNPAAPNPVVDLSAFSGVTRIVIRDIDDPAGLGFDDFTFTVDVVAVPEPASLALLGLGVVGLAFMRRRRVA
jgi:hypothetical protein